MHDAAADPAPSEVEPPELSAQAGKNRFGTISVLSMGLLALFAAYFMSVRFVEIALDREIQARVENAIVVTHFNRPVIPQIKDKFSEYEDKWSPHPLPAADMRMPREVPGREVGTAALRARLASEQAVPEGAPAGGGGD